MCLPLSGLFFLKVIYSFAVLHVVLQHKVKKNKLCVYSRTAGVVLYNTAQHCKFDCRPNILNLFLLQC